ncbi:TonB-dependent receptor domain-containing protein [Sphingomonas sp. RIT328]|uniref:TonB-dependent receptor domain-containing protein n=1 Tax=Sphingomonas sp. RIT328 TaxID=1470591 RepID=UPI00044CAFEE|nr:TonB-dependent receptor [Sphingomonas sp. RIT328]EZP54201.1 TonB-dependent receptor [Sphingomonas sp. RIT328]
MTRRHRSYLLNSTLLVGVALVASPALAQTAPATQETQQQTDDPNTPPPAAEGQDIVVTGTLIRNPNLVSSSPVNVVSENELTLRNVNNVEQILRELPGSVPGIGSAVNNGTGGFSTVNLRNLGSQRNLVLLDGDRIVPAQSGGSVDLNNIPTALIQRLDVLTGGASTSYGADAVSGVVNFITKKNFSGMEASASQQITEKGDANYFRADLTVGANFDDGRGNAVLSLGYQEADPLYQGARDISVYGIDSGSGVASGSSRTSVPTTLTFNRAQAALAGVPTSGNLQVNPAGTGLVAFYNGFNFNPYNIFQTPYKRYNFFGQANYEINDNLEVYTRGLFSKNTVQQIIAPSGVFGENLTIPGNNPYLPAAIRDQLCLANSIALGATCNTNTAIPLGAVYRRSVELGPRVSTYTTTVFDYKAGLRLRFSDHVKLDVSGAYGESDLNQSQTGYVLRSRVQQALNATNTTTCNNTANGCVPVNLFGAAGSISSDQANFLSGQSSIAVHTALSQAKAVLNGDFGTTSPFANEPIAFAAGGEYRKYSYSRVPDAYALSPGELGGAGGAVLPFSGSYDVREAFGELIAPLVADKPFFHSLTLEAGVRYSDYKVQATNSPKFSATTYKVGGSFEPVEEIKFRGNYQRAVRAPNIGELFSPVATGLDNLSPGLDPCVGALPLTSANLALACRNQGAPASSIGSISEPISGQPNVTGGGNPDIRPEIAKTYTVGVVIQPRGVVPGLSVAVDYFNIKIENAIAFATPADILSACFGSSPASITAAQAASSACTSIRRNSADGSLSGSSASVAGLPQPLTNRGRLRTDGIDLNANYKRTLGEIGLDVGFQGTWTNHNYFRASETSYDRDCVGYFSTSCASIQPAFAWNQRTSLSFGPGTLSLLWRHIGAVKYEALAPDAALRQVTTPLFSGVVTGPTPLAGGTYNFNRIGAYNYLDLSAQVEVNDHLTFTFGVRNMLNKKAPLVGSTAGSTSFNSGNTYPSTYDVLGRLFNVSGKLRF